MAKKQKSFEEKTSGSKGKDLVHVKFVKSVPSDKEGYWRFNESMIGLEKGQKLDAALKQMEDEANLVDIEMPSTDSEPNEDLIDQTNEEIVETKKLQLKKKPQKRKKLQLKKKLLKRKKNDIFLERWPSGLRRSPGTRVGFTPSQVRILSSPLEFENNYL